MACRRLRDDFIKKEELLKLFKEPKQGCTLGKNDLCWKALSEGLITKIECEASLERRTSTIPCYLHTHIRHPEIQRLIEEYVRCYSRLFSRGSYIANLVAMKELPNLLPIHIPTISFIRVPSFLSKEDILKKCFLPERWFKNPDLIDKGIFEIVQEHSDLLAPFLPPNYNSLMCNTGWDNALNHMGSSYKGSVKVQILTHLPRRLSTYFSSYYKPKSGTNKSLLATLLLKPLRPLSNIHNDDFSLIQSIRSALEVGSKDFMEQKLEKISDYVWSLHCWLQNRLSKDEKVSSSILPVATMNRKYAYLDHKIVNSLLPTKIKKEIKTLTDDHKGSDLQKLLGLTPELFNNRLSSSRKKKRNTNKNKKKWRERGRGSLPKNALIKCISTDGVGLRLCVEFIPVPKSEERPFVLEKDNHILVGNDTGRVRLNTSVDSHGKVTMMTRKGYYYTQHHHRMAVWERSRMHGTAWGAALAELSETGGLRNNDLMTWRNFLEVQGKNIDVLLEEQVNNIERAKRKMFRFRKKKSWMDRRMKEWLAPAHKLKQQMVIGVGDGKFASGGRGELSVPTSALQTAFKKSLKVLKIKRLVKTVPVDEYNTTKCCHRCDNIMQLIPCHERNCQRYRLCTHCSQETGGKRRHRDVNAARNILHLLDLMIEGKERPEHLRCPWKKYVAFPPFEKTA